jgi:hypothetical protein
MAVKNYICRVQQAGYADDHVMLLLREVGGSLNGYFIAPANAEKEMLSVGLTAVANNMTVRADLEAPPPQYSTIIRLLLVNDKVT